MSKILVVEDDPSVAAVVKDALTGAQFAVDLVGSGEDALTYIKAVEYDLLVLDWQLPDLSGIDIVSTYRSAGGGSPVLFLTGRNSVNDKITGLESGADDYLTKPFDVRELVTRVHALLRRPAAFTYKKIKVRDLELDPIKHTLTSAGREISLYPKEFALLELFMRHPQRVFSPQELVDKVWPTDSEASIELLRVTILRLRQKVDTDQTRPLIRTIRSVGYRLEA